MSKKQRFAIKKLSIGVVSVCIGYAFLVQAPMVSADTYSKESEVVAIAPEKSDQITDSSHQDSALTPVEEGVDSVGEVATSDNTDLTNDNETASVPVSPSLFRNVSTPTEKQSGEKTALELLEENAAFKDSDTIASYDKTKKDQLNTILLTNFETTADNVAMSNVVSPKTYLAASDLTTYYIPLLTEFKKKHNLPFQVNSMTPEQKALYDAYLPEATKEALRLANANITNNDELESVAPSTKTTLQHLLAKDLLGTNNSLTVKTLKADLPALYRGVFLLEQQYHFEDNLVDRLVFEPHSIKGITANGLTPYERLKQYGGATVDQRSSFLRQSERLFKDRKVSDFTGFASIPEMVEHLATSHQMSPENYYKTRTEALLGETSGTSVYETIKDKKPELYLPLLSQGKGVYAGASINAFTIGMTETYLDQYPPELLRKERGQNQPNNPFFLPMLKGFNNYMSFLESVKKNPIPFVTATDSFNHKYDTQKVGVWSKADGPEAADAVRRFFTPLKMRDDYKKSGVGIGGVSTSAASLVAYETRLMNKDMSGVGLFTHEMTHGNDEAAMYGGTYRKHGRRLGQGPEVFARGLFEAIDNTQHSGSPYIPVFNLNTAIDIRESAERVQARQALKDKATLENYLKNLMDLVAYLEVKEAEVVFEHLTDKQKKTYFNQVSQIRPTSDKSLHLTKAGEGRISTNDKFAPYTDANVSLNSIKDLVNNGAVSGQFIPRGVSPLINELTTNQYDSVPLLDSFYAVQAQNASDKNTVGDISFKRHAYEILAWKGWEAYVNYASDRYSNDADAFRAILNGEANNSWSTFKELQYQRLSKLKPVNQLWDDAELKTNLETAIKKDLEILEAYKNDITNLTKEKGSLTETDLTAVAQKHQLRARLTNVRQVKLGILKKALAHNDLMSLVLVPNEYDIIYVSNTGTGDGETPTTPMRDLNQALDKVREGGKIVFVGNVTERSPLTISKPVTIEGQTPSMTLLLNEALSVNANLTLKNVTLNMVPEETKTPTIRVANQSLTMENVMTNVAKRPELKPVIQLHGDQSRLLVSGNTELKQVQVYNAAEVSFDTRDVRVKDGLQVLANQNETVTVLSKSNFITSMVGNRSSHLNVILDSNFSNMSLSDVNDLTLRNGATATLTPVTANVVNNHLRVDKGSRLTLEENSLVLERLSGEGELHLNADSQVTAQNADASVRGMSITFRKANLDFSDYDGKRFVYLLAKAADPTVTLVPLNKTLSPNDENGWIYNVEKLVVYHFISDNQTQLPTATKNYLPKERLVVTGDTIKLQDIATKLDADDGKGEWVFTGWKNSGNEMLDTLTIDSTTDNVTDVYGVWHYQLKPSDAPVAETRKEVIPYTTTYVADDTLSVGKQVVEVIGVNGEKTYTITDGVSDTGRITKKVINERIKIGTKPTVTVEDIPFETRYVADESKIYSPNSEPVERVAGENGKVIRTTTYTVDSQNGSLTSQTETVRKEPVTRYLVVGTGSTTRTEVIPFNVIEELSHQLLKNQRQIKVLGQNGEKRYTDTYLLDAVSGQVTKQTDTEGVISIAPKHQLVLVGTLVSGQSSHNPPKVELEEAVISETVIPHGVEVIDNPQLPLGRRILKRQGIYGRRRLIHVGEKLVSEEIILQPITELIEEGSKRETTVSNKAPVLELPEATVSEEIIPFMTETILDETMLQGERHVTREGQNGLRLVIRVNGEIVSDTVHSSAVSELVRIGTKVSHNVSTEAPVLELPEAIVEYVVEREGNSLNYYDIWKDSKGNLITKVLISSNGDKKQELEVQEMLSKESDWYPVDTKLSSNEVPSKMTEVVNGTISNQSPTVLPKTGEQSNTIFSILSSLGLLGLIGLRAKKED